MYYRIVKMIISLIFRLLARIEIVGVENVPQEGPYIVICNHLSRFDPPLLLIALPARMTVLAANKYRDHPLFGPFLSSMGAIYVRRGEVDRQALRACLNALKGGGIIGMAPEGTRSSTGALQEGRTGVAYLASRAGVPILPVAITGTEKIPASLKRFRRGQVKVVIGETFTLPVTERKARGKQLKEFTELIMRRLADLLPEEYRGVYR
ncbi:MAG TPA: 1-acyl-sn-glycerol-3-phosphate acyltransferase [Anaerolineae bacterium]|nr:1-acyl-sn-glycerol-3-phosphate acyltransferase [Anaerolineae bacterium]